MADLKDDRIEAEAETPKADLSSEQRAMRASQPLEALPDKEAGWRRAEASDRFGDQGEGRIFRAVELTPQREAWERTEAEKIEEAGQGLQEVEWLRPERWKGLDSSRRRVALAAAGKRISDAYAWPAPPMIEKDFPDRCLLGTYKDDDYMIELNARALSRDDPEEALSTYLHEYRHSYQAEQVHRCRQFPHLVEHADKVVQWEENSRNYIDPDVDLEGYAHQPLEQDAREFEEKVLEQWRKEREVDRGA